MKDRPPCWFGVFLVAAMAMLCCGMAASLPAPPVAIPARQAGAATVTNLRCEYLRDPLGIDTPKPRLSWVIESERRGEWQTAYRVLVASTPATLAKDEGDLWDSGKVALDQSIQVEYAGQPLQSRQRCFWKVRVWDKAGQRSAWSRTAFWTMGLLQPQDWSAKWIGAEMAPPPSVTLIILRASYGTADSDASMDVTAVLAKAVKPDGLRVLVSNDTFGRDPSPGREKRLRVEYELDGRSGAQDVPEGKEMTLGPAENYNPAPLFRKTFAVAKPVARATAFISGLGYYEFHLNGGKVGDHVLDPAFTRYDRRVLYVTYDVTRQLVRGKNTIGVMLGNSWYNYLVRNAWNFDKASWRDNPKMILQLAVEFTDGSTTTVISDESWKCSAGPIRWNSLMVGEIYDARLEKPGWDTVPYEDSNWTAAPLVSAPKGVLSAQMLPPIRITETIKPVKLTQPKPGVWLFDIGRNIAGGVRLSVRGPAGAAIKLQYGERLHDDGTLDQRNISVHVYHDEFQTDRYILKGYGVETWQSRFQYHGFQYVQVTGFPGQPTRDSIEALVELTDLESVGRFECSHELLNNIQRVTRWTYRNNFHGHPTDCPQREKNGWTGDAHLAAETGLYNFDAAAGYTHWMRGFRDEQRPDGQFPCIIPDDGWGAGGAGPAWEAAGILIPAYMYRYRGDLRIIADQYDLMKRYLDYLTAHTQDGICRIGLGDWCPAKTGTSAAITSTASYHEIARTVAWAAGRLGRNDDSAKYDALAAKIKKAFQREFTQLRTQTAMSCALYQNMLEPSQVSAVVSNLVAAVHAANDHLDCGILGTKYLLHALSDNGHAELAYKIATQTTTPSWGDWIVNHGATTLWEKWGRDARDVVAFGSRDHVAFGDISAWMYKTLAGICPDPDASGFKQSIIKPTIVGDVTWVKAHHDSPYGRIVSHWTRNGDRLTMEITIPPNTTATVHVPAKDAALVTEGDQPAAQAKGVKLLRMEAGAAVFHVGSGSYLFQSVLQNAGTQTPKGESR
ncbi:MAG: family 78 glycoside hydrolase catalytic domain [Chloroflexi bacterium]|nr:family 78 glycoside hydrolase catalytic domain [Chloroflexota bacterium]